MDDKAKRIALEKCVDKLQELNTWLRHTEIPPIILAIELDGFVKILIATYLDNIEDPELRKKMADEIEVIKRKKSKEVEDFMENMGMQKAAMLRMARSFQNKFVEVEKDGN